MKQYFAILTVIFFLTSATAAISVAQPYWVEVDVSPFAGSDFQLELYLYNNSGVVGDSWAFIDNIFIKGAAGVIERINFESGTLEQFDDSLNPESVEVVDGTWCSGAYMMRINEDSLVTPTLVWRDFLPSDATILHLEFDFFISDDRDNSSEQDILVASLLNPSEKLEPLITGLKGSGDFLEASVSGNSISAEVTGIGIIGDVNLDGVVDILDLITVGREFSSSPPNNHVADVNEDNIVDILDLVIVGQHFGPRWDVNRDGVVDILDLIIVGREFNSSPPKNLAADVNEDNIVDISDLVIVERHFGEITRPATANANIRQFTTTKKMAIVK
jgi:hypothetical protein